MADPDHTEFLLGLLNAIGSPLWAAAMSKNNPAQTAIAEGGICPVYALQTLQLYRNLHLFLGPTFATDRIGLHLGVGF